MSLALVANLQMASLSLGKSTKACSPRDYRLGSTEIAIDEEIIYSMGFLRRENTSGQSS